MGREKRKKDEREIEHRLTIDVPLLLSYLNIRQNSKLICICILAN